MRWKSRDYKCWKSGDKRTLKKFLLFPKTIIKETRWLETAEWEEECAVVYYDVGFNERVEFWIPTRWLNK